MATNEKNIESSFWWESLGTGVFITNDGNVIINPTIMGNNLLTGNNVYLSKNCKYLGNTWQQILIITQSKDIKQYLTNLGIKFMIDLDDHDMCVDGMMGFRVSKKENYVERGYQQSRSFITTVTFNHTQHEYIRNAIRKGMKLFQESALLLAKKNLEQRLENMRSMHNENEEDDYRYNGEIISLNAEIMRINDKLDFINGKL